MVIKKTVLVLDFTRIEDRKEAESSISIGKSSPSPPVMHHYRSLIPYPQRVAWSQLSKFEPRFALFLDILRRIYAGVPFLEALKEAQHI